MPRSRTARPRARHARPLAIWKRALIVLVSCVALVVAGTSSAFAFAVWKLDHNIHHVNITADLGTDRPVKHVPAASRGGSTSSKPSEPVDILIMGSDTRAGDNGFVGGDEQDARSDTTILLHISGDRSAAYGISIPRDSMVHIPVCKSTATKKDYFTGNAPHMFNEAFTIGGAACTVKTVEQTTGVRIDHYVVVDFHGFNAMVSALGGVEVCVPQALDDNTHDIHLKAGRNTIKGKAALDYVRARYRLGDGTDVGRTERQQYFIGAMIRKALGQGLTRPDKLLRFLDAATQSLQTDMDINDLRTLAQQVEGIGLKNINFATVPTMPYPQDVNRLLWTAQADQIWKALQDDTVLPGMKRRSSSSASPSPSATPLPSVPVAPSSVRVRVVSGTGDLTAAQALADELRTQGYVVTEVQQGTRTDVATTTVRYDPAYDRSATTLTTSIPGSVEQSAPELSRTLEVLVGSDGPTVVKVRVKPTATPSPSSSPLAIRSALSDGCGTVSGGSASASPSASATPTASALAG
ncbi:LytR family transcriptional attenuator [Motilibacter rhizosphaerae]|uniref:LytR family transcriptional attenuator n=1 Tax=Motilibacter rhizosphaerae TaxID=598652 RepID=A0A4Q7NT73_9ACTN|nr:LCP family protein [Motilibacter rhizosphaerae]RZS90194.1 LytR family transcriptional attenuator [Motilibacter rhizosphaerae]